MKDKRLEKHITYREIYYSRQFAYKLEEEITKAKKESGALFMIEICNLSFISSIYGVDFSDKILSELLGKLKGFIEKSSFIERTGGRYFCLIIPNCNQEQAFAYSEKIHKFVQLFSSEKMKKYDVHISLLIGSVLFPEFAKDNITAIDHAFLALKNVRKDLGRYYSPYSSFKKRVLELKKEMKEATLFKQAIADNRLQLMFQPIVKVKDKSTEYYECLLRIKDQKGQLVSAGPHIRHAENLLFIDLIDELVLKMVVEELKKKPKITLSFNISSHAIYNKSWLNLAKELLKDRKIAKRTIVEITETAMQMDLYDSTKFIKDLHKLGCRIALDDFGAGFTSISQLTSLPLDIVKIDGGFIKDIAKNEASYEIVKALCLINKSLKFKTVAEFVESKQIYDLLKEIGVDYAQGYYLGKPTYSCLTSNFVSNNS